MSKKYLNKICAYCAESVSTAGDHVFAKKFFLEDKRSNLPQVPVCDKCNTDKSKLENYLMTILPFGGRHEDAHKNLTEMAPKRLAKNTRLHKKLSAGIGLFRILQSSGISARKTGIRFRNSELWKSVSKLSEYLVRGLYCWHHNNVTLEKDTYVKAWPLSANEKNIFIQIL
ncbi:MAG: hypothetical protein GY699_03790 [Desulfobacteraceae bacterium]|nr:hypothetical protein [Desulfobacteraceae bacterium]